MDGACLASRSTGKTATKMDGQFTRDLYAVTRIDWYIPKNREKSKDLVSATKNLKLKKIWKSDNGENKQNSRL